jgi:hypothetical protein
MGYPCKLKFFLDNLEIFGNQVSTSNNIIMQMTVTLAGAASQKLWTFFASTEDFKVIDVGINDDGLYTAF